jgi:hypothetical protein
MATIHIKAQLSYEDLLNAIDQLNLPDLEKLVSQVISLQAKRKAKSFSKDETELLLKINQKIDPKIKERYDELITKRQEEILSSQEYDELLKLTNEVEKFNVKRVENLTRLAQLRNVTLDELMKNLGI